MKNLLPYNELIDICAEVVYKKHIGKISDKKVAISIDDKLYGRLGYKLDDLYMYIYEQTGHRLSFYKLNNNKLEILLRALKPKL